MDKRNLNSYQTEKTENPIPQFTKYLQSKLPGKIEIEEVDTNVKLLNENHCEENIFNIVYNSNGDGRVIGKVTERDDKFNEREVECSSQLPSEDVPFSLGLNLTFFKKNLRYREEWKSDKLSWEKERIDGYDVPFP